MIKLWYIKLGKWSLIGWILITIILFFVVGFLNYKNNGHVEGNMGIWDLVMALEWIQTNMKQLNGDPSKITIMGESAGAAAVSVLAVSPKTKGEMMPYPIIILFFINILNYPYFKADF